MIPIECIQEAALGKRVLVVVDSNRTLSEVVGRGSLFIRNFRLTGLRSVSVDMVYLVGNVPEEAAKLAAERCRASINGRVIRLAGP